MTNEELATLIQSGQSYHIPELWNKVYRLIYLKAGRYYNAHQERCARSGVELCDIEQAGYLAFLEALKAFKPESGLKFLSFLSFPFRNAVNELLRSRRNEPLNNAVSLDAPIKEEDGEDTSLLDLQPDPDAERFIDSIERAMISEYIRNEVESLNDRRRDVIVWYYFDGKTGPQIAELLGVTVSRVQQIRTSAERELRHDDGLRELYYQYFRPSGNRSSFWNPEHYEYANQEELTLQKMKQSKSCRELLEEFRKLTALDRNINA